MAGPGGTGSGVAMAEGVAVGADVGGVAFPLTCPSAGVAAMATIAARANDPAPAPLRICVTTPRAYCPLARTAPVVAAVALAIAALAVSSVTTGSSTALAPIAPCSIVTVAAL